VADGCRRALEAGKQMAPGWSQSAHGAGRHRPQSQPGRRKPSALSGRSPERLCGQGCEPGKAGEPGRLAEARTGQGHGRKHDRGGADAVKPEAVLAGPPGLPATGECGGGQADEHRDCRQIVRNSSTGGVGESIGRSGRVAADRISGEDRRADKPCSCGADQGRCCPAGRRITGARQACGSGQEQRPCHGKVSGLDPAARSERERTDRVAQRPVTISDSTLEQEHRNKDRSCGHTAVQQPAGPCLRRAGDAGRVHKRSVAGQEPAPRQAAVPRICHSAAPRCSARRRGPESLCAAASH
jgi:hypothetical protein